jgi:hypothetical protein
LPPDLLQPIRSGAGPLLTTAEPMLALDYCWAIAGPMHRIFLWMHRNVYIPMDAQECQ